MPRRGVGAAAFGLTTLEAFDTGWASKGAIIQRDSAHTTMIRIAIVDDHAMVRAGLRLFFADQPDFTVVAEGSNGREALAIVRQGDVDVILMDIAMPDQSGVDALAAIKARKPELPVLILSGYPETHYATTLLRQGASGYLNK